MQMISKWYANDGHGEKMGETTLEIFGGGEDGEVARWDTSIMDQWYPGISGEHVPIIILKSVGSPKTLGFPTYPVHGSFTRLQPRSTQPARYCSQLPCMPGGLDKRQAPFSSSLVPLNGIRWISTTRHQHQCHPYCILWVFLSHIQFRKSSKMFQTTTFMLKVLCAFRAWSQSVTSCAVPPTKGQNKNTGKEVSNCLKVQNSY